MDANGGDASTLVKFRAGEIVAGTGVSKYEDEAVSKIDDSVDAWAGAAAAPAPGDAPLPGAVAAGGVNDLGAGIEGVPPPAPAVQNGAQRRRRRRKRRHGGGGDAELVASLPVRVLPFAKASAFLVESLVLVRIAAFTARTKLLEKGAAAGAEAQTKAGSKERRLPARKIPTLMCYLILVPTRPML